MKMVIDRILEVYKDYHEGRKHYYSKTVFKHDIKCYEEVAADIVSALDSNKLSDVRDAIKKYLVDNEHNVSNEVEHFIEVWDWFDDTNLYRQLLIRQWNDIVVGYVFKNQPIKELAFTGVSANDNVICLAAKEAIKNNQIPRIFLLEQYKNNLGIVNYIESLE